MWIAVAVTLLLIAVVHTQRQTGNDDAKPAPRPTPSREADLEKPGETQQEEVRGMLGALEDLREDTAALADEHQLVLTIHDDPPLDIWTVDAGVCVADSEFPASIEVAGPDGAQLISGEPIPPEARLLDDGACEASTTVTVDHAATYDISIKLVGRDNPKVTRVPHEGTSQEVTLFR
jgi:hypothetical protein